MISSLIGVWQSLKWLGQTMSSKYFMREFNRLGFGRQCKRSAHLLNRIFVAGEDQDGQRCVKIQLDARRVEMALRDNGDSMERERNRCAHLDSSLTTRNRHREHALREVSETLHIGITETKRIHSLIVGIRSKNSSTLCNKWILGHETCRSLCPM